MSHFVPAYTSSLYLPGSIGRYRQYPYPVRTPIPGANVRGGKLIWGSELLNIDGAPRVRYSTARLPLLGLGNYLGQASAVGVAEDIFSRARANWQLIGIGFCLGVLAGREGQRRGVLANRRRRR